MRLRVACIGAGTIGRSWATLFAGKGCEVVLHDTDENALVVAKQCINRNFRNLVKSSLINSKDARKALDRIEYTAHITEAVSGADFVQESVPESLPLKRRVFSKISHLTPREVVIASSSGGFPASKIQATSKWPERCIVIHPCQIPVHLTRLVEIVPGRRTNEGTVKVASDLMKKVGKQPIIMKREVQDYITNRLQFTLLREALDMVGRGIVEAEDVDVALCEFSKAAFCIGLGPFLQAHIHGGPHGLGGIEGCMDYYAEILPDTWRSLAKWTRIPPRVKLEVERSVSRMMMKRGTNDEELVRWRDSSMVPLSRSVWRP